MSRGYPQTDGTMGPYPDDRNDARRLRSNIYHNREDGSVCLLCRQYTTNATGSSDRHTKNDECMNCSRLNAGDFGRLAIGLTRVSTVDLSDPSVRWVVEIPYCHVNGQHYKDRPAMRSIPNGLVDNFRESLTLLGVLDDSVPEVLSVTRAAPTNAKDAVEQGVPVYVDIQACSEYGHLGLRTITNECYFCKQLRAVKSPRQVARMAGERWYTPAEPCKHCDTTAKRRVSNGECSGCTGVAPRDDGSPRQTAIAAGNSWYTPLTPCKRCGTTAERKVSNGDCSGCKDTLVVVDKPDKRQTVDSQLMRETPDLVLSRDDARAMGFKVYRTGNACRKSHTGYRYVSTGNCIECLRS